MNPILWQRMKDLGILMPYRTYRRAKELDLDLGLVCAVLSLIPAYQQRGLLVELPDLAEAIRDLGLYSGLARFSYYQGVSDTRVLENMRYFKVTLGIKRNRTPKS